MRKLFWTLLLLAACAPGPQVDLSPKRALVGEEVTATLTGARAEGARVLVEGVEAEVVRASGNALVFRVPQVGGGPKAVEVQTPKGIATAALGVLGQVARDRVLLRLPPGQSPRALPEGFSLIRRDDLRDCGFALAELGYTGEALGRALEELEALDPSYKADPESLWSLDSWGAKAIGAFQPIGGAFQAKGWPWPSWTPGWTRPFPSFPATTLWRMTLCLRMPSSRTATARGPRAW